MELSQSQGQSPSHNTTTQHQTLAPLACTRDASFWNSQQLYSGSSSCWWANASADKPGWRAQEWNPWERVNVKPSEPRERILLCLSCSCWTQHKPKVLSDSSCVFLWKPSILSSSFFQWDLFTHQTPLSNWLLWGVFTPYQSLTTVRRQSWEIFGCHFREAGRLSGSPLLKNRPTSRKLLQELFLCTWASPTCCFIQFLKAERFPRCSL